MSPYIKKPFKQMGKDYTKYKADELLNDDYFLQSELYPTENNRKFWYQLQQTDNTFSKEIEVARLFLKGIKNWFFVTFGAVKYANRLYLWSQPAYLRE